MKFIHCADIHLDSPLRGLARYADAPTEELRGASRRAFENLIDLALEQSVAFVLIAGDLYDGDWQDFNTGLFFVGQMARLQKAGISVFLVKGNHDADSRITRQLPLPANVHLFVCAAPETRVDESLGIAVHGQSFAEAAVRQDLAATYPPPVPGKLNIGLLHTCVNGREGHAPYAPCSLDTLIARGYDYWALGHVHGREVLHQNPWVVFPGNIQGRHIRETGPKGCELVTFEADRIVRVEPVAVDVVRWLLLELDTEGAQSRSEVLERLQVRLRHELSLAQGRGLAVRVRLVGRCPAHADLVAHPESFKAEVRAVALSCGRGELWIEKVRIETRPDHDTTALSLRDDAIGDLIRLIHTVQEDEEALREFALDWHELSRKSPPELTEGASLTDPGRLRAILSDVEQTIVPRLLEFIR